MCDIIITTTIKINVLVSLEWNMGQLLAVTKDKIRNLQKLIPNQNRKL